MTTDQTKDLRDRMRDLLRTTIDYYAGDPPARRATNGGGISGSTCRYITTDHERRCAVGRYIVRPELLEAHDLGSLNPHGVRRFLAKTGHDGAKMAWEEAWVRFDALFHTAYQGIPQPFWSQLQGLHDRSENWDDSGLSKKGEGLVGAIERAIEAGYYDPTPLPADYGSNCGDGIYPIVRPDNKGGFVAGDPGDYRLCGVPV